MQSVQNIPKADLKGRFLIGKVVDNNDPLKQERVRVRVPALFDNCPDSALPWALPVKQRLQGATSAVGSFGVPQIGTDVIIMFDDGDHHAMLYLGSVITAEDLKITGNYVASYGFHDAGGNTFHVDTSTNEVQFLHATGTSFKIRSNGDVELHSVGDIKADANNIFATAQQNITVQAGGNISVQATGNMSATVGGNLTASITGNATITAAAIQSTGPWSHTGTFNISGLLSLAGGLAAAAGGGASATFACPIASTADISTTTAISAATVTGTTNVFVGPTNLPLLTHRHADPQGGTVGTPIP